MIRLALLLGLLAAPAAAEAPTGLWRILRIGAAAMPPSDDAGRMHVEIAEGALRARLACAYVEARLDGDRPVAGSAVVDAAKCPVIEAARAAFLAAALDAPGARLVRDGDRLRIGDGVEMELRPGTDGPPAGLADLLGGWRVVAVDGAPARPGIEPDRPAWVGLEPFRVGLSGGCNGGGARIAWTATGWRAIDPVISTAMACDGLMAQEMRVFAIGADVARIERVGAGLRLHGAGGGTLTLARP